MSVICEVLLALKPPLTSRQGLRPIEANERHMQLVNTRGKRDGTGLGDLLILMRDQTWQTV